MQANALNETVRAMARLAPLERAALRESTDSMPINPTSGQMSIWLAGRWLRRWRELGGSAVFQGNNQMSGLPARRPDRPMAHLDDRQFVLLAHEALLQRGCQFDELSHWTKLLTEGRVARIEMMARLSLNYRQQRQKDAERRSGGELVFHVMGTGERVTEAQWHQRRSDRLSTASATGPGKALLDERGGQRKEERREQLPAGLLITAITSLYKGGRHIERFLRNMASQTCFASHVEVIIIDAASPDGEQPIVEGWARQHPNIRYLRLERRVGIYEAWNQALRMATGKYVTSANVDDLRRVDSFELQACALEADSAADVVYQDFYYTLDADLPFDDIARIDVRSRLPDVSAAELMRCNPPHNAPMWRRSLHDELGLFDESLQSAGDYDFWMRCALAGKRFHKVADPHVAYLHNPEGISTRPDTRGYAETREVHRRYARHIHGSTPPMAAS